MIPTTKRVYYFTFGYYFHITCQNFYLEVLVVQKVQMALVDLAVPEDLAVQGSHWAREVLVHRVVRKFLE